MEPPNLLVRLLHSVPHVNISLHPVNSTFNLKSSVYIESLGILASIPAALLILSLVGLLLYLLTRCCDRKQRKSKSQSCQKCTLITITLFCCAAIGLGLYGNDDFHNGLLQSFGSGRDIKRMIFNFTNKTGQLKSDLRTKVLQSNVYELFDKPTYNQTGLQMLHDQVRLMRENTTKAVTGIDMVLHLTRSVDQEDSLKHLLKLGDMYEAIRWPATLGFFTVLLLLCSILVIGVARSSRCALIFFSVFGLFGVIVCWLLSGIYLAGAVAMGDFCMRPMDYMCRQFGKKPDVNYLNCGVLRNNCLVRLTESRDNIDKARAAFLLVSRFSHELYQQMDHTAVIEPIDRELSTGREQLQQLMEMLDTQTVNKHYVEAMRGLCNSGLFGLSLMMVASLVAAALLTILVCVDSHTWIYLTKRKRLTIDKSETTPFLNSSASTASPTQPQILSGTSTINRTLLHHQQPQHHHDAVPMLPTGGPVPMMSGGGSSLGGGVGGRHAGNGMSAIRGSAYSGDSPPPDYNIVVHDSRHATNSAAGHHHTLGRLPSQHMQMHHGSGLGPNNGKYATLSKQCKTLESSDFY